MRAEFIPKSPLLQPGKLEGVLSRVMARSLEEYRALVIRLQLAGPATGKVVVKNGIRHQQSAIGEPPSPLTFALVNSTVAKQESYKRGEVKVNQPYGNRLQTKLNRPITTNAERLFEPIFKKNVADAMKELD